MTTDEEIEQLLAQADALKAMSKAEAALEKATEAYRAKQTEATKTAYRKANEDLAEARRTARADRKASVGGDAFVSGEG